MHGQEGARANSGSNGVFSCTKNGLRVGRNDPHASLDLGQSDRNGDTVFPPPGSCVLVRGKAGEAIKSHDYD